MTIEEAIALIRKRAPLLACVLTDEDIGHAMLSTSDRENDVQRAARDLGIRIGQLTIGAEKGGQ